MELVVAKTNDYSFIQPSVSKRVEYLEIENQRLKDEIEILRASVGLSEDIPILFGLTPLQIKFFGVLLRAKSRIVSIDTLISLIYDLNDPPSDKIITVHICNINRKLKAHGIVIKSKWGMGYYLPVESVTLYDEICGRVAK